MTRLIVIFIITVVFCNCGGSKEEIERANENIVKEIETCSGLEKKFVSQIEGLDQKQIFEALNTFTNYCYASKVTISNQQVPEEMIEFKKAALDLMTSYEANFQNYSEISRLYTFDFKENSDSLADIVAKRIFESVTPSLEHLRQVQIATEKKLNQN
jgi:hypothetical protein